MKNRKKNTEKSDEPGVSGTAVDEGISDDDSDSVTVVVRSAEKRKLDSSESEGYDSDLDSQTTPRKNIRCHKRLMKEQYKYFKQYGFTDELITIVLDEGWDKINIENYVLLYNHKNKEHVPLPILSRQKEIYGRSCEKEKNQKSKKGNENPKSKKGKEGNEDGGKKEEDRGGSRDNGEKKAGNNEGVESSTSGRKGEGSEKDGARNKIGKGGESGKNGKKKKKAYGQLGQWTR